MPADTPPAQSGGGGALGGLKHKFGPLPLWGWMAAILGLALAYEVYKSHQASSSSTATTATNGAVPADQVPDVIIQNDLQGPGTTGPTGPVGPPGPPGPTVPPRQPGPPATGTVTVPNLVGQRANFALGDLQSIGLEGIGKTNRNPKDEYDVAGQSIKAGTKVPKGTRVTLTWKQIKS